MATEDMRAGRKMLACAVLVAAGLAAAIGTGPGASAQEQVERVLFTAVDDAEFAIIDTINRETKRIDVGVWYLGDQGIVNALINRFQARVPVRVLGDWMPNFVTDSQGPGSTRAMFEQLARAGIPIRLRYHPTWFPEAMHWKGAIFAGQGVVEFGSANWIPFQLAPFSPSDYSDETAMFTNDPAIVNRFLTEFDRMWVDTMYFVDWPEVYKLQTGTEWPTLMNISRTRLEGDHADVPGMVWSQGAALNNAMAAEIDRETSAVDLVIYRLSDPVITDAAIRRLRAGVPVRVIVEPIQYRSPDWPEYWLTGAEVDRLWVAGAQIKQRVHQGLTHMKSLITSHVALNGSSNFTRNWQRDHNYFISATSKPALWQAMKDRFNAMFNDRVNFGTFRPLPPETPVLLGPADGATNVSTTPTLQWNRPRWAVAFDVELTPFGGSVVRHRVNAVLTETPPDTYSWTGTLQPNTTYAWRIVSRTFATEKDGSLIAPSETRTFTTGGTSGGGGGGGTPPPTGSSPFGGTPVPLPGTIEAENFDEGGEGVAYHDSTRGNIGGAFRPTGDVDIAAADEGGYTLGWVTGDEWLNYTVNVTAAGTYNIDVRVASHGAGGTFRIFVNGVDKTGRIQVPNTGGWMAFTTIPIPGVSLSAGPQVLRLAMESAGSTGYVGNFTWIAVGSGGGTPPPPEVCGNGIDDDGDGQIDEGCPPSPTGPTPYTGTPVSLPGTIEAENFDLGGEGVAYHDLTSINEGGAYRSEGVDIAGAADTGGGYTVGWVAATEWLNYSVNVASAGTYDIEVRVASMGPGGTFHIAANGTNITGTISVPDTGDWQRWMTVRKTGVTLSAGQQIWQVVMDSAGASGGVANFNWIRVVAAGGTTPPPPTSAPEIVIYGADVPAGNLIGNWAHVNDSSAAATKRLASSNLAVSTVDPPPSTPANYFDVTFNAQAGVRYRLWIRMRAESDSKFNDSIWVQFTNSVDAAGSPRYRIGTAQGLNVNLAVTSSGGLSGWGWQNHAYWLPDTGEVWFATSGTQTIRIQIREDGVSLDQIILSPVRYVDSPPGPLTNDKTIVPKS